MQWCRDAPGIVRSDMTHTHRRAWRASRARCGAVRDEENVPAEQSQEKEDSRIPRSNEVPGRASRSEAAPEQGSQAHRGLSGARRQAFPRTARLTKRREFQEVYKTGLRVPGTLATIFVRPGATDEARLGITATRRVGNAVVRNRLRRIVRESFRRHRHRMKAWDLVVNVSPRARGRPFRAVDAELARLLRRAEKQLEGAADQRRPDEKR